MTPAVCAADGDALPGRRQGSKLYTLSLVRHVGGTKKRAQQCKLALRQRVIKNKICYSNVMKHIVKTKSNQKSGLKIWKVFASRTGEKAISADSGNPNAPIAQDSACTGFQKHGLSSISGQMSFLDTRF
jgi:hypothetical protein